MIIDGYTTPGTERETQLNGDELLSEMDSAGIDRAVIAPEDREIAMFNASGNSRITEMARRACGRFIPACSVNPWRGNEAIELLRSAVAKGAKLLVLAPALQGFIPTDPLSTPLLEAAGELGIPVYFHTGPHCSGGPTQVVLLAQQFPSTRFVLGHGGSTDHVHDMPAVLEHHRLENLWFELSFVRPWSVGYFLSAAGSDRIIFGSSAPRQSPSFELNQFDRYMPITENPGPYGANIAMLLEETKL